MIILLFLFQAITTIMGFLTPILSILAPIITQYLKKKMNLQGNGAVLLTVAIAIGLAVFGAWATGAFVGATVATIFTTIFTASTLIYKLIIANDSVQASLPESLKN